MSVMLTKQDFGTHLLGRPGTYLFTVIVTLSCLGALNAKIFAIGRLIQAAVKRSYMPTFLGTPATRRKMAWHTAPPPPRYEARGLGADGVGVVVSDGGEGRPLMTAESEDDGPRLNLKRIHSSWRDIDYGTGSVREGDDEPPM